VCREGHSMHSTNKYTIVTTHGFISDIKDADGNSYYDVLKALSLKLLYKFCSAARSAPGGGPLSPVCRKFALQSEDAMRKYRVLGLAFPLFDPLNLQPGAQYAKKLRNAAEYLGLPLAGGEDALVERIAARVGVSPQVVLNFLGHARSDGPRVDAATHKRIGKDARDGAGDAAAAGRREAAHREGLVTLHEILADLYRISELATPAQKLAYVAKRLGFKQSDGESMKRAISARLDIDPSDVSDAILSAR